MRSLARWRLPRAKPESLKEVPLAGSTRQDRFTLAELAAHRGRTVEAVLADSIAAYLERSNYNNPGEVKKTLERIGIDDHTLAVDFAQLGHLMDRRHWIVHRADENQNQGRGHHQAQSIDVSTVQLWTQAVRDLVSETGRAARAANATLHNDVADA